MPRTAVTFAIESPDQPDVLTLIAELDAYQDTLYPPESRYATDLAALAKTTVLFVVARDAAARAIGCGAVVIGRGERDYGELKRMYVRPENRGQGIASRMLALLESAAQENSCPLLMLETGPKQPEAIALYARHGYETRGRFGDYPDDPLSVFMQKCIA